MLTVSSDLRIHYGQQIINVKTSASGSLVFSFPDWPSLKEAFGVVRKRGFSVFTFRKKLRFIVQPIEILVKDRRILKIAQGQIENFSISHVFQIVKYLILS